LTKKKNVVITKNIYNRHRYLCNSWRKTGQNSLAE